LVVGCSTVEHSNGGSVDGMGNWMGNDRGGVVGGSWVVGGSVGDGGRVVVGLSAVGHIGNITVVVVGVVGDSLDSAVGKVDRVGSSNNTISVILLLLVEGSTTVVISHGVGVLVGRGLSEVISNISGLHRGVVGGGVVNWGSVSWGSMDSVVDGGVDSVVDGGVDSVGNWVGNSVVDGGNNAVAENGGSVVNSVVDWGVHCVVSNNSISSVKSVGGISNDSSVSPEGLALGGGPVLALVRLAHRLVADLAVAVSVDWLVGSVVDGSGSGGHRGGQDGGVSHGVVSHGMVGHVWVGVEAEVSAGGSQDSGEAEEGLHVVVNVLSR